MATKTSSLDRPLRRIKSFLGIGSSSRHPTTSQLSPDSFRAASSTTGVNLCVPHAEPPTDRKVEVLCAEIDGKQELAAISSKKPRDGDDNEKSTVDEGYQSSETDRTDTSEDEFVSLFPDDEDRVDFPEPSHPDVLKNVHTGDRALDDHGPGTCESGQSEHMDERIHRFCEAEQCENPGPTRKVFYCNKCLVTLCGVCWDKQAAHKRNKGHVRTSPEDQDMVNRIMKPPSANADSLHQANYGSKWFGVSIQHKKVALNTINRHVTLNTTNRYRELSMDTHFQHEQYPALISFVGQTGAGKSTLISALVNTARSGNSDAATATSTLCGTQAPIVGDEKHKDKPTSGDVHLFRDPSSWNSNQPCLFADCEGLQGGNSDPIAVQTLERVKTQLGELRNRGFQALKIKWATSEKICCRSWMVEQLYPRILFTFSDVVCFVERNMRTIETVFAQLIKWADMVIQKSVNQPMLPFAIIVINGLKKESTNHGVDWWSDELTKEQLERLKNCVNSDPELRKFAELWRSMGTDVQTLEDLVRCYYSGIKIVCIPDMESHDATYVIERYQKLRQEIHDAAKTTKEARKKAHLLMNSDELGVYFGYAFDLFSTHALGPFNFLAAAFHRQPVNATFKTHIIKAASCLLETRSFDTAAELFKTLSPLIASSILLEVCRKGYPQKNSADKMLEEYARQLDSAFEQFYMGRWPCRYTNGKRRCVNVANRHHKGHQTERGNIFAMGSYVHDEENGIDPSAVERRCKEFFEAVHSEYQRLASSLESQGVEECTRLATGLHKATLTQKFGDIWNNSGSRASHSTCFGCLFSTPRHTLTCGHVLCDNCVDDYSHRDRDSLYLTLRTCPLCGPTDSGGKRQWSIKREPREAAPRVLCLDGGGVRSIIQLRILRHIEQEIGLEIPIREFFDLIIGTSAGGIVALGLGARQMSVEACIRMFKTFAEKAFTKRAGCNVPVLKYVIEILGEGQCETTSLKSVLKEAFGEERIFGETKNLKVQRDLKFGVTMTSSSGVPYFAASYNRAAPEKNKYEFLRAETKEKELKIWEAARATSAAPRYFKPFYHKATGHTFSDGALCFNNPIRIADNERQLLWPHHDHPDVLLSIGTGSRGVAGLGRDETETQNELNGPMGYLHRLKIIVVHQTEQNMSAQRDWENWKLEHREAFATEKYIRMNLELTEPLPRLDQVNDLDSLDLEATNYCRENHLLIRGIADRLIASLFYFTLENCETVEEKYLCKGTILCRLEAGSEPLRKLCQTLMPQYVDPCDSSVFQVQSKVDGPTIELPGVSEAIQKVQAAYFDARWARWKNMAEPFALDVEFHVESIDDEICISMSSLKGGKGSRSVPISSFPTSLTHLRELWRGRKKSDVSLPQEPIPGVVVSSS